MDQKAGRATRRQTRRDRIADAAELYWIQGMKLEEVGEELGLSRSTVSRLLAQAREENIVEFIVHREDNTQAALRQEIHRRYGVSVAVPPVEPDDDLSLRQLMVGREAALWLGGMVHPDMVLGISWGSTVEAMSSQLRRQPLDNVRAVQLHGSGHSEALGENYAGEILGRFGDAFSANVTLFPVPPIFDSAVTRAAMWQEGSVKQVLKLRATTDIMITSVGSSEGPNPSKLYRSGYLSDDDLKELTAQHVVGNLGSVFFRDDGSTDGIPLNERCTGMPFHEIRKIPTRLFVVAHPERAQALHVLLEQGLVTHLVVDPLTAENLLKY